MSTEQQIKSAIDTLNEALQLMQNLGFVQEPEENYLASDCIKCKREYNYLEHKSDTCLYCEEAGL